MALTLVFLVACLAFGANGKGLHHNKVEQPAVCTGQQVACLNCVASVDFVHGTINDDGFEAAVVEFGESICAVLDEKSPEYKKCADKIATVPERTRQFADESMSNPQELCSFVCPQKDPISNMCHQQKAPAANYDCDVKPTTAAESDACIICKGVPQFVKQLLTGDGFLGVLQTFLLVDCDILPPGCEKDRCEYHTEFIKIKIKFVVTEFLNPEASCSFVCGE